MAEACSINQKSWSTNGYLEIHIVSYKHDTERVNWNWDKAFALKACCIIYMSVVVLKYHCQGN